MIDWICLNCGKKLEVPDERAGAEEPCSACGKPVQLPVTQVPIPSFPLPRTTDGTVAIPGDCTVGSPSDRAERQATVDRYRRWRRRGMIIGLIPSVTVAGVLVILSAVNGSNANESVPTRIIQSVLGLACAACWSGCLGAGVGAIFARLTTERPRSESMTDLPMSQ